MEADTIVAMVTPPGEGGVGMVRASGPGAEGLAHHLFPGLRGAWESHRLRFGRVVDPRSGAVIDEAMGVLMRAPRSYTGEDVFELHLHGNPLLIERVIRLCLAAGCRPARPGEFTLRAFLHGRLDLSQAEAVMEVVRARTNAGLELAVQQLSGWLGQHLEPLRQQLMGTLARLEAMVDFVEEDVPDELDQATRDELAEALAGVQLLLQGAEQGITLREGAALCLVGSPNVGKSSIMNGLLGLDRSIVTAIPGTTRDTVEEMLQIRDIPFRLVDTAGITDTADVVEQIGIERSRRSVRAADVILLVLDRSRPLTAGDQLAVDAVREALHQGEEEGRAARVVVALNKSDLPEALVMDGLLAGMTLAACVSSNAVTRDGLEALRGALADAALGGARQEVVPAGARHQDALRRAAGALRAALLGLEDGTPLDLVSFDVRDAAQALGEISGIEVGDELLDRIFRDFCIGK